MSLADRIMSHLRPPKPHRGAHVIHQTAASGETRTVTAKPTNFTVIRTAVNPNHPAHPLDGGTEAVRVVLPRGEKP